MSRFDTQVAAMQGYWRGVFGTGPAFETCMAASVGFLGLLYVLVLPWMLTCCLTKAVRAN